MPSRLQAEIKQTKPFARLEHEAILGLLRTAAIVDHANDEALRPFGITGTQFNVLRILRGAGENGLCGREVGERMINRVPDVPRLLDRMEKAGLIGRDRDPDDRRHVTARITEKGRALLDESFVWIHRTGEPIDRNGLVDALRSGRLEYVKLETSDVSVAVYGDAAVARGVSQRQREVDKEPFASFFTITFIRRPEGWKAVSMHSHRPQEY